jgi:hypothetical protein
VILHRPRGRLQERIKSLLDDGITLTRRSLETRAIEHLDRAPVVADEAGRLHRLRRKRYGFTVSAQDLRQEFMRIRKRLAFRAVVHHQKPSAHSFFRRMHRIARDRLLHLGQQRLRVAHKRDCVRSR